MFSFNLVSVSVVALALSTVGCAASATAGDDSSSTAADLTSVDPGVFSLYTQPDPMIDARCNVFTKLTLDGTKAAFEEATSGICEIYVIPNAREYRLTLVDTSCGSKIYKGTTAEGARKHDVTITDNRDRVCKDFVEATIVVDETDANGALQTRYSDK